MKKILPSLLSADFTKLDTEISALEAAGADILHVDIMDGHFVPNITIGPSMVKQISKVSKIPLDVHLMIENLELFIPKYLESNPEVLTFHLEAKGKTLELINLIKKHGSLAGLSIRPQTPVTDLLPFIDKLDLILIMSVNPGFGGQKFMKESIPRIKELKQILDDRSLSPIIEVDGGVNLDNISNLSQAGVNYFVAGNTIFKANDRKKMITRLRSKI